MQAQLLLPWNLAPYFLAFWQILSDLSIQYEYIHEQLGTRKHVSALANSYQVDVSLCFTAKGTKQTAVNPGHSPRFQTSRV